MLVRLVLGALALTAVFYGLSLTLDRVAPADPGEAPCVECEAAPPGEDAAPAPDQPPPRTLLSDLLGPGSSREDGDGDGDDDGDDEDDDDDDEERPRKKGKGRGG